MEMTMLAAIVLMITSTISITLTAYKIGFDHGKRKQAEKTAEGIVKAIKKAEKTLLK